MNEKQFNIFFENQKKLINSVTEILKIFNGQLKKQQTDINQLNELASRGNYYKSTQIGLSTGAPEHTDLMI